MYFSCLLIRYQTYVDPKLRKDPWTLAEDEVLLKQYDEYGNNWMVIASFLEGRFVCCVCVLFSPFGCAFGFPQRHLGFMNLSTEKRGKYEEIGWTQMTCCNNTISRSYQMVMVSVLEGTSAFVFIRSLV